MTHLYTLENLPRNSPETKIHTPFTAPQHKNYHITNIIHNLSLCDTNSLSDDNVRYIKHIITIGNESINGVTKIHIPLNDHSDSPIGDYIYIIDDIYNFLLKGESVIVHCERGISRSPSFIIAFLIKYGIDINNPRPMTYDCAFRYVWGKRPIICPNLGFGMFLEDFAETFQK